MTKEVFREFRKKRLTTKEKLFNYAISEGNYDVVIILIFRGANLNGLPSAKLDKIIKETKILDDDYVRVLVSRGSDLAGISYRKLIEMFNANPVKESIENYLILKIVCIQAE